MTRRGGTLGWKCVLKPEGRRCGLDGDKLIGQGRGGATEKEGGGEAREGETDVHREGGGVWALAWGGILVGMGGAWVAVGRGLVR